MNESSDFYKKMGAGGLKLMADAFSVDEDLEFVFLHAGKDDAILDLACGYGRVTLALSRAGYAHLTGIDISENLIESARADAQKERLSITFDIGNMTHLPYADDSFDTIFCLWNAFNEILDQDNQLQALLEIKRTLVKGGKAYFTMLDPEDPNIVNNLASHPNYKERLFQKIHNDGADVYQFIYTKEYLEALVRTVLFAQTSVSYLQLESRRRLLLTLTK